MNISFDFPLILTSLVIISGLICLADLVYFAPKRKEVQAKQSIIIEYARSFFPVLFIVLLIRSFLIQPYRVPTGSLEPTVLPGDFIVVNQFAYGLRLPVLNTKIVKIGEPKVGDVVLFRYPKNPSLIYVKRVIGASGDHIVYKNKQLTINGKVAKQKDVGAALDIEPIGPIAVDKRIEDLNGVKHDIFIRKNYDENDNFDITVPKGEYFMMGDNRDNSDDSRDWGFVPEKNLVGKAFGIWLSWDSENTSIRWHRIGSKIK